VERDEYLGGWIAATTMVGQVTLHTLYTPTYTTRPAPLTPQR
jgi:hypothetical protein